MTHVVAALRENVRLALTSALDPVAFPKRHWDTLVIEDLPRGGVATPIVRVRRIDTDTVERTLDLLVMLKRSGDETIEDVLMQDSASIETTILPVLDLVSDDFDLIETRLSADAQGKADVGELAMLFRVVLRTDETQPEG
ncbi:MAG: hypothetical protein ACWA5A_09275 [Marinibacterium sp.]